jgi:urea carboxylase-associated protein 2
MHLAFSSGANEGENGLESPVMATITPLWTEVLRGGSHWSAVLRRGLSLRMAASGADANVAALFYSREQPLERYNMADTLKAQHTAHLTAGCVCYSDMGRVLCAITADSLGWHDPLCGLTDKASIDARYGITTYQQHRNARHVSGQEAMLVELGKYGLAERDLVASINFFSKVVVDETGAMRLATGHCHAGDAIDLRFEMDCIVLLHAGPHPMATGTHYAPPDVHLTAFRSAPQASDDPCRNRCPENARGYLNTERHVAA